MKSLNLPKYFSVILACLFFSCGDDPVTPTPPSTSDPSSPDSPNTEEVLSPAEQKEYLETVALEFIKEFSASDFDKLSNICEDIDELYGEDYDWDMVDDWAEKAFDSSREALGSPTTNTEKYTYSYGTNIYTNIYNYITTNYKSIILASNFTGHFTANNGGWTRKNSDHLQFDFTDKQGKSYALKLETSGNVKRVHMLDIEDWDTYYQSEGYNYTYNNYIDYTSYTIGLPETIKITLSEGSNQIISNIIKFDLSGITNEEFDISRNSLSFSTIIEIDNGYRVDISRVAYSANKNASASVVISKGEKKLVTIGAAADVNDIPSVNLGAFSDFDIDDYETDKTNAKNAFVKLDIIGKIQLQGKLSDARKFADYLEEADDNDNSESNFKSYINQANSLADINLFYNGNSVKQADVKFEAFVDYSWNGVEYWTAEPVLYFFDGSSYSTFEAFFREKDFENTIDTFEELIHDFAELFDEDFEW